jgi:hypothetical protein
LGLQSVEHALGQPARIGVRLHDQRRHRADQDGFRDAALTLSSDVVHHFAAGGVPHMDRIVQIEMRSHRREVVGVAVHVVAAAGLGRASVSAPVVGDHAVAEL